jgi:hypothetical protein
VQPSLTGPKYSIEVDIQLAIDSGFAYAKVYKPSGFLANRNEYTARKSWSDAQVKAGRWGIPASFD